MMIDLRQIKVKDESQISGSEWTLLAGGDFHSLNRFTHPSDGAARLAVTDQLQELITGSDVSVVNMESPIKTSVSPIKKSGPSIRTDEAAPQALKQIGFNTISLANNHVMDYGASALNRTIESCLGAGLLVCGAGADEDQAMKPAEHIVAGDIRVSVLAFCEREFGIAGEGTPGAAWVSSPLALRRVAETAQSADVVIVIAHGGVESAPFSPIQRQAQLRQFIDAGATLVIGHHPHVPQGWERYGAGLIFHSLGNFLFDNASDAGYSEMEWGLIVKARFKGKTLVGIDLIPVETQGDRRILGLTAQDSDEQQRLGYLQRLSDLIAEPETYRAYWQETAVYLWETRYEPWLRYACAQHKSVDSIRFHLEGLYQGLRRKIGRATVQEKPPASYDPASGLLLLNTIRNESHRWTVETAMSVIHGDEEDLRTPEIQAEVRELLALTEHS